MISAGVSWAAWTSRAQPLPTVASRRAVCLALVAAICNAPNLGTYNQILLLPGFLLVFEQRKALLQAGGFLRCLAGLVLAVLLLPWVTCVALLIVKFVFHADAGVRQAMQVPWFGIMQLPLSMLALLLGLPTEKRSAGKSSRSVPRGVSCSL